MASNITTKCKLCNEHSIAMVMLASKYLANLDSRCIALFSTTLGSTLNLGTPILGILTLYPTRLTHLNQRFNHAISFIGISTLCVSLVLLKWLRNVKKSGKAVE